MILDLVLVLIPFRLLLHLTVPAESSMKYVYYAEENICYDICIQL